MIPLYQDVVLSVTWLAVIYKAPLATLSPSVVTSLSLTLRRYAFVSPLIHRDCRGLTSDVPAPAWPESPGFGLA